MKNKVSLPGERIENKIFLIRGKRVMIDRDLAELYGVETRALNQAVKRNLKRFPADFMFKLNKQEAFNWSETASRSQIVTLNHNLRSQIVTSSYGGRRYEVSVFTEQGVAMLSSVLKSERAVQVNIQIMRTFTKLRELLATNKELREKIEKLEKRYDAKFRIVFEAIQKLLSVPETPKRKLGF